MVADSARERTGHLLAIRPSAASAMTARDRREAVLVVDDVVALCELWTRSCSARSAPPTKIKVREIRGAGATLSPRRCPRDLGRGAEGGVAAPTEWERRALPAGCAKALIRGGSRGRCRSRPGSGTEVVKPVTAAAIRSLALKSSTTSRCPTIACTVCTPVVTGSGWVN